jgi:hypothetical protein
VRQVVVLLWEAMVDEMRAARLDLAARAVFAENGQRVTETRGAIAGITADDVPAPRPVSTADAARQSAARMKQALRDGFVEVG